MSFDHLGGFFKRFKNLTPPDETVRKTVVLFIKESFEKELPVKNVRVQNTFVYVDCSPALKSALFLKKQELISYIYKKTNTTINDVR